MKPVMLAILAVAIVAGCGPRDPIERIVQKESGNAYFGNGMYSPINLPATASVEQVICKIFPPGTKILTNREVRISDEMYRAALVETGGQRKVLLLQYHPGSKISGWWHKVYED